MLNNLYFFVSNFRKWEFEKWIRKYLRLNFIVSLYAERP